MSNVTERSIEAATYTRWYEIVGNYRLKAYLQGMVRSIVGPARGQGINTLAIGPPRSGKSSSIEFAIRSVLCSNVTVDHLMPCGKCYSCVQSGGRYELIDMDHILNGGMSRDVCFVPIDGNRATQTDLDVAIERSNGRATWRWIYYIDEIQGLVRRHLDHSLLKVVEQQKQITWIVSTATTKGLEPMFRKRFTEVMTELPTVDELATFLGQRCCAQGVDIKWDDNATLILLAERSQQITGDALKCLAFAKMMGGTLTREMVEHYPFDQIEA